MKKHRQVVALLGSSGNLGSKVMERNKNNSTFELIAVTRGKRGENEFHIDDKKEISHPRGMLPDLIVNLSNYYSPRETTEDVSRMEEAILGTAKILTKYISKHQVGLISASTYLQYAPDPFRPWSKYADFKQQAQLQLFEECGKTGTNFVDFVLYDNYGGRSRGKFIDQLLNSLEDESSLDATPGAQILNLTHINDVADGFLLQIKLTLESGLNSQKIFELKSNYTKSLRDIVLDVQSYTGLHPSVNWGAIPYRDHEVFEHWNNDLEVPNWWTPKIDFPTWLQARQNSNPLRSA